MAIKVEPANGLTRYLLIKLAEEASELAKAATKAANFGLLSLNPKEGRQSHECIDDEHRDVLSILRMIDDVAEITVSVPLQYRDHEISQDILFRCATKLAYAKVAIAAGILVPSPRERDYMERVTEDAARMGWVAPALHYDVIETGTF